MYWLRYTQTKEKVLSPPSSIYLFPSIFFGPIVIVLIGYSPPISVRSIFYFYTYENLQEPLLAITIVLCCFLIGFVPIKISTHTHTREMKGEKCLRCCLWARMGTCFILYCRVLFMGKAVGYFGVQFVWDSNSVRLGGIIFGFSFLTVSFYI